MTIRPTLPALLLAFAAACGGDDAPGMIDAPPGIDGPPSSVVEVACAGANPVETVVTTATSYVPNALTIAPGDVVRFDPTPGHDVQGEGWRVALGGDACFRFDEAGSFTFFCTVHGFNGTVTVQ